jgi:hypothetical protein
MPALRLEDGASQGGLVLIPCFKGLRINNIVPSLKTMHKHAIERAGLSSAVSQLFLPGQHFNVKLIICIGLFQLYRFMCHFHAV